MTNRKSTKRALIASVISLMLCFTMLLGTTYAWFTDSVTSTNNIITSGNLDVELYYQVEGQTGWTKVTETSNIFMENALWEPGHTEVVKLKVVNEGSLALKYQLGVNVADEVGSVNVYGDEFKLSEFIKYGIVAGAQNYTRDTAIAAVDATANSLNVAYNSGTTKLEAGADNVVTMVVYMPTDVGNDANYAKGKAVPTINLGINLYATQVESESDSFGTDYDENATHEEFEVFTAADLQAAVSNAEAGDKIILRNDIKVTEPIVIPAPAAATYSLRNASSAVVLNLNGKTITTAYNEATQKHAYAIDNYGNLEIVGGTIEARGIYNQEGASLTVNGARIVNLDTNGGSCIWSYGGNVVLNNAELIGYTGCVYSLGYLEINGGTYTCYSSVLDDGTQISPTYTIRSYGELVINDGNFTSRHGLVAVSGKAVINGGTYTMNSIGVITSHVIYVFSKNSEVTVNGGKFNCDLRTAQANGSSQICVNAEDVTVNIFGGTFNHKSFEKYVAEGYTAVDNGNGTWSVIFPQESFDSLIENAGDNATIEIPAGTYTFPASDLKAGQTLNCAPGTVFNGTSSLNVNGATIIGATFDADSKDISASGTINGTFKDCTFTGGSEGVRWCYTNAGETVVFENCVFEATKRGIHFDAMDGDVKFINCKINGFNAIGGEGTVTFENCTFGNDKSKYNGLNMYCNTVLTDCTFNFISGNTNFIDFEKAGKSLTITNCTATLDGAEANLLDFVGGTYKAQTTITVDGALQKSASNQNELNQAVSGTGDVEITLSNGEYTLPSSGTTGEVTISGTKDAVLDVTLGAYLDSADGVTIEGITIKTGTGMANGNGCDYAALYAKDVTYKNCTFIGPMRVGRDGAKFINCTFTELGNDYIWTYGNDVTFEGCTFNTDGKAILIYSDGGNEVSQVTVKNCIFNSTKGAKAGAIANQNCAAIEIHNYGNGVNLTVSDNTYDSNFSGEWRIKTYENGKPQIFVNGTEYTQIAVDGKLMSIDADRNVTVAD